MWTIKHRRQPWTPPPATADLPTPEPERLDGCALRPHPDVVARQLGAEVFLVHLSRGSVYRLNQTGQMVWRLLEAARSPAEIIERLHASYGGISRDRLAQDVQLLCRELVRCSLVEMPAEISP